MNVYADHAATTPMRACAKEAMLEALEDFGNPSSIHSAGRLAAVRLESARKEVAELLNCRPSEIYFTSGGTEADNWAIRAARYGDGHVVASAFEHHAIIHALEAMAREKERHVELIHPNRQINIPNLEAMIRAAAKDGVDICTYCPDYNCRGCIVNEWKEDPDDE